MHTSSSQLAVGVFFAVVATLCWALNFIAPFVTGAYSLFDLLALRFIIAGLMGAVLVIAYWPYVRALSWASRMMALALGNIGYLGYSACIAGGVTFGGPVLTPAFIGMVPLLLALLGNAQTKTLPWRRLRMPLALLGLGLLLVNASGGLPTSAALPSLRAGLAFSVAAVALWLAFSLLNQAALDKVAKNATAAWTGLMMVGGALGTLLMLPLGLRLGLFELPAVGFSFSRAGHLYGWALLIGVCCSVMGAWAWNKATHNLPMVLSGQLIALESLFATLLGLFFHGRLPSLPETAGLLMVLTGATIAVHSILVSQGKRETTGKGGNQAKRGTSD